MSGGLPLLLRLAMRLEGVASAALRRSAALTQRVAFGRVPPSRREAVTAALYSRMASFAPGGDKYAAGLFPWEVAALGHADFPRSGRVLVGGAGGGREVVALAERGYQVVGFEPAAGLVATGREAAARTGRAELLHGSYEDLVAGERGGPLEAVLAAAPYDAVILGWGSLSHVLDAALRDRLLVTMRRLAPAGPLLLSYMRHGDADGLVAEAATVRFAPHAGYYRTMSHGELCDVAARAGYELAMSTETPYPHALLVPARPEPGSPTS